VSMQDKCADTKHLSSSDLVTCKQVCEPATCCFYEDVDCGNHIDCSFYSFCRNVLGFDAFPPVDQNGGTGHGVDELDLKTDDIIIAPENGFAGPTPEEVAKECADLSMLGAEDSCYSHCSSYRCCFDFDYDPISCHGSQICDQYKICEKLSFIDVELPEKEAPVQTYPKPAVNLGAVCNIKMIAGYKDPFYENQCIELCKPAECCRDDVCRHIDQ